MHVQYVNQHACRAISPWSIIFASAGNQDSTGGSSQGLWVWFPATVDLPLYSKHPTCHKGNLHLCSQSLLLEPWLVFIPQRKWWFVLGVCTRGSKYFGSPAWTSSGGIYMFRPSFPVHSAGASLYNAGLTLVSLSHSLAGYWLVTVYLSSSLSIYGQ